MATRTLSTRIAAALLALTVAGLAGCSAGTAESTPDLAPVQADGFGGRQLDTGSAEGGGSYASDLAAAPQAERSVISTGDLSLEVGDTARAGEEVESVAQGLGGRLESKSVSGSDQGFAQLSLRVPSDRFDEAMDELSGLGRVLGESRSATDVTMQHVDLQARVDSLQATVARLTDLMSQASTTSELIEAEQALAQRQADLDALNAQLQALEGQVDEATIWVTLQTKSALPGGPATFWEGLLAGLHSIWAFAAGAVVLLGVLLPWAALIAVVGAAIFIPLRRRRRAKRAQAADPKP